TLFRPRPRPTAFQDHSWIGKCSQAGAGVSRKRRVDIAVLDDDIDFVQYVEDFLKDEGLYTVRTFTDPSDLAASYAKKTPEIVLLDMKMGPFQGQEVLDDLKRKHPGICVIVVTGYPSLEDMRATFKSQACDYLAKPFSLAQLRQTLKNAIEKHSLGLSPREQLRQRLGKRLRVLRVERAWSLKETARETAISVSQLSSIERGAHMPSIESLLALCTAYAVKPSELLRSIDF
ncbi:MAG: response regulator, partial [Acidobacteria bacterium]|nr:response regulator [Acidobacteriota bacterium]